MDDFPSLRSLEGIGRSLGTERPSFSPLQENELADPTNPRQSEGRERPEERFEARVEEAERRARRERTRDQEETAVEARSQQETRESDDPGDANRAAESKENTQAEDTTEAQADGSVDAKELAQGQSRFGGVQGTLLSTAAASTTSTTPPALEVSEHLQGAAQSAPLELGAITASTKTTGADYTALGLDEPLDALQQLSLNGLDTGQGSTQGESFQRGGGQNLDAGSVPAGSTATGTATAAPSEAFAALLTNEITEGSSTTKTVTARADAGARDLPPTQREVELAGDVLRQFRMQLQPGLNQATLHLRPAHLGRVAIRLHVEEGRLRATLRAEKPETLGILEAHLPELRASLEGQGFEAQEFDLGLGDSNQPEFQDFFREQNATSKHDPAAAHNALTESELLQDALQKRLHAGDTSVDTYA